MKKILSVVLALIIGALSVPFNAFAAENGELTVPADINVEYTPFFEYTETDTASSRDAGFLFDKQRFQLYNVLCNKHWLGIVRGVLIW